MLIDTHAHLSKEDDIKKVIQNAKKEGVNYIILGGCDKKSNFENIDIALKYENVYASVGFHPEFANYICDKDINELEKLIQETSKVVAIGEIGLDYHYGKENRLLQIELFEKQMSFAEKLKIPVIIHTRDAIMETYEILKKYNVKGIIHCFSGSYEMAKKFISLGYKLGIGGILTFKNSSLKDVINNISLDDIVFETDSPYLSPRRGEVNEPKNVRIVAEFLADIKNVSVSEVERITTENVVRLFDLDI